MKDLEIAKLFKLLGDETRLRIFVLLARKELCVCQIMAVLGISQPLVSRNLSLLSGAGLFATRRKGKLTFYSIRKGLSPLAEDVLRILKRHAGREMLLLKDMDALADCEDFQKVAGKCDMKTFLEFMDRQRKKRGRSWNG